MAKFAGHTHHIWCAPKHPKNPRMCQKKHVLGTSEKLDICATPAQFRVGVITLGMAQPHWGPQGVGS